MKFIVTKTCQGIMDTEIERQRIKKAFKDEPEIRKRLTFLMDAIEAGQWKKASRMLEGKWWGDYDDKRGCPRREFIGSPELRNPQWKGQLENGFDHWHGYASLVYRMSHQVKGGVKYVVEKI